MHPPRTAPPPHRQIDLATGELAPATRPRREESLHVPCGNRRETVCPRARPSTSATPASSSVPASGRQGRPRDDHRASVRVRHLHRAVLRPGPRPPDARQDVLPCRPRRDAKTRAARTAGTSPARPGTLRLIPGSASRCARTATTTKRGAVQRLRGRPVAPVHHLPAPPPGPSRRDHPENPAPRSASGSSRSPSTRPAASSIPRRHPARRPWRGFQPPPRAYTDRLLCDAIDQAATSHLAIDHGGRTVALSFGAQTDTRIVRLRTDLTHRPGAGGQAVANYIAKYATKTLRAPAYPAPGSGAQPTSTGCAARPTTGA